MAVQFWTRGGRAILYAAGIERKSVRSIRFVTESGARMTILRKDIISIEG